jgi:hypothetical protein
MSTPPGQEPRPGFTPRPGQARPGPRGDSGWADDGGSRDEPGSRRPARGSSGRAPGGDARDADHDVEDYWLGGGSSGAGSRPRPAFSPAKRPPAPRDPARGDISRRDASRGEAVPRRPRPDDRDSASRDRGGAARPAGGPASGRRDRGWRDTAGGTAGRGGLGEARRPGTGRREDAPTIVSGRGGAATGISGLPGASGSGTGPRPIPGTGWIAAWPTRLAILVLFAASLLGMIATIMIGHDPGFLIGFFLIIGALVAALGIRRRPHRLIPLPAIFYVVAITVSGSVHDSSVLNGGKEWVTNFLTWIGGAFFALVWATVGIAVIAAIRGLLGRRGETWRPSAEGSGPALTSPGPDRPGSPADRGPQVPARRHQGPLRGSRSGRQRLRRPR